MEAWIFALVGAVLWALVVAMWRAQADAHSRWFAVLMFAVGAGSFGIAVHRLAMPWLRALGAAPAVYEAARLVFIGSLLVYFLVFSYASLMSAVMFCRFLPRPMRTWAPWVLPLPFLMALLQTRVYPVLVLDVFRFRHWAAAYLAVSSVLYIYTLVAETGIPRRGNAVRTSVITVLTNAWLYASEYAVSGKQVVVGPTFFTHVRNSAWEYHLPMVWLVIGLIVFLAVRYGVLGVRMRIGRERVDHALRSSAAGGARVRQWLQYDMAGLEAAGQALAEAVNAGRSTAAGEAASDLLAAAGRMQGTVERLRDETGEVHVNEQVVTGRALVEAVVASVRMRAEAAKAKVAGIVPEDVLLRCDPAHVHRALVSLCQNALESLPPTGGTVTVSLLRDGSGPVSRAVFTVSDDGHGIAETTWQRVFQPFFTTRNAEQHLGLGLPRAQHIAHKHGGNVAVVASEPGVGTTMALTLPRRRVIRWVGMGMTNGDGEKPY